NRRGPAVIHERAGNLRGEAIVDRVVGQHVHVVLVRRDLGRVKVHAVRHGGSVDQGKVDRVSLSNPDDRPGHGPLTRPRGVLDSRRARDRAVADLEADGAPPPARTGGGEWVDGGGVACCADRRLSGGDVRRTGGGCLGGGGAPAGRPSLRLGRAGG